MSVLDSNTQLTSSKLEECSKHIEFFEDKHISKLKEQVSSLQSVKADRSELNLSMYNLLLLFPTHYTSSLM